MYVDSTGKVSSSDIVGSGSTTKKASNSMDKDAFLKMLCAQLQNQDPMNPADSTEQIAQMASFSSLEQMQNLNKSFETLAKTISDQLVPSIQFQQAGSMIGRTVVFENPDAEADEEKYLSGVVSSVSFKDGKPVYKIGGQEIGQDQIIAIGKASEGADVDLLNKILKELEELNAAAQKQAGEENGSQDSISPDPDSTAQN